MAKPSKEISPARFAAFKILKQVETGAFSSILLAAEEPHLLPADRALCHDLVLGVLRWQLLLDKILEHFSKRAIESLDPPVRIALRLGLYQLRYLTRIPASAAVNESVSLVRAARLSSATALVNAVLRRATREAEYDPATEVSDSIEKIAIQSSHPIWLIDRWAQAFGLDQAESFANANNLMPPTAFRVVANRANQAEVLSKLSAVGATVESSDIVDEAWRVSGATSLLRELSAAGQIYLQDEASQLVARELDVKPNERVLDLCAAPGGKTTLMADRSEDRAFIVAADISATRMATVVNTMRLHELKSIKPTLVDAVESLPFVEGSFDRVLVDAPCSGTGTLRRNPEIRWRLTPVDIVKLAEQQKQILRRAVEMVKPGGRLVYSTCSVEPEENEEVIEEVLVPDTRFELLKTTRTWPQREGCDGFFISIFQRRLNASLECGDLSPLW
ncbi:MAG TPA: 16S rRNA (cytosine(967)-C(5))-methyltransferase RsmB [Pyrinomonadaceae bacterium]|nr:16S rRNA (cytosine(967)-C(5))-methyltransferase RsmB [Pyrinomonadaceae bacterium]